MKAKAQMIEEPPLKFCPYCGSQRVRILRYVPRCDDCRVTFSLRFSRYLRAAIRERFKQEQERG